LSPPVTLTNRRLSAGVAQPKALALGGVCVPSLRPSDSASSAANGAEPKSWTILAAIQAARIWLPFGLKWQHWST
jgi:hypothetical protein